MNPGTGNFTEKTSDTRWKTLKEMQKWPWNPYDKTTWKYIDCLITGQTAGKLRVSEWILNPDFAYKHLDK